MKTAHVTARMRSGSVGIPAGLFLLMIALLPLLLTHDTLSAALKPLLNALILGFALAGAMALDLGDPYKAWSVTGLALCAAGSLSALPNLRIPRAELVGPGLHFLGVA